MDCIRSSSCEALDWVKAMCQGEGANVPLESDKEDEEESKKVSFSIYNVCVENLNTFFINLNIFPEGPTS